MECFILHIFVVHHHIELSCSDLKEGEGQSENNRNQKSLPNGRQESSPDHVEGIKFESNSHSVWLWLYLSSCSNDTSH